MPYCENTRTPNSGTDFGDRNGAPEMGPIFSKFHISIPNLSQTHAIVTKLANLSGSVAAVYRVNRSSAKTAKNSLCTQNSFDILPLTNSRQSLDAAISNSS